jgi:ferritin-like metal-binding protein YciE
LKKSCKINSAMPLQALPMRAPQSCGSTQGTAALDAGLLAAAQAVEHYEISRYGALKAWADKLGLSEAAELLGTTLDEEKKTDEALTEIAESVVNPEADET